MEARYGVHGPKLASDQRSHRRHCRFRCIQLDASFERKETLQPRTGLCHSDLSWANGTIVRSRIFSHTSPTTLTIDSLAIGHPYSVTKALAIVARSDRASSAARKATKCASLIDLNVRELIAIQPPQLGVLSHWMRPLQDRSPCSMFDLG